MTDNSRRHFLGMSAALGSAAALPAAAANAMTANPKSDLQDAATPKPLDQRVKYCLNTSTLRGHRLSVPEQIRVCAEAGYDAIEPWMGDLRQYVEQGGSLKELSKMLSDSNLSVESAIGFARWIVDDESERQRGLEEARRDMELLAEIGGKRIAAPPIGAHQSAGPSLDVIAERYRALLEIGDQTQVVPELELWGFSKTLSRLGELAYVAVEAGHPSACVLPDVYHIYKGGSAFDGLSMIEASRMHVFHMNDYPDTPPREKISDRDRVYPGDGVAPLDSILGTLSDHGFNGVLSLELFNESYWKEPAGDVASTGLSKMKMAVASASQSR